MAWTTNGINYVCQNYGDTTNCVTSQAITFDYIDWKDIPYTGATGSTSDIVSAIAFNLFKSITLKNPSRPKIDDPLFKVNTANESSVNPEMGSELRQHDENSTDQWCYSGVNYILTASISPSGTGSIVLTPPGGSYPSGTVVTVRANATTGYAFDHWSGSLTGTTNPTTITMNSNKSITANFTTSNTVTCWGCSGTESISNQYPLGTICSETNTPGYPSPTEQNCGQILCSQHKTKETCIAGGCFWYSDLPFTKEYCHSKKEDPMTKYLIYGGIALVGLAIAVTILKRRQ
jgi:hypothetical protein